MKNILIAGATGFIGQKLTWDLLKKNYSISVITRNIEQSKLVFGNVIHYVEWDGKHSNNDLNTAIENAYAVINLAGESIAKKWTKKQKKRIIESRVQTTRILVNAIKVAKNPVKVFIQASAVGYYGTSEESVFNENSPNGSGFLADVCQKWEAETKPLTDLSVRRIILRTGIVIDKNGGVLEKLMPAFRYYLGGHIGSGRQWLSWIHRTDEIRAITFLLENKNCSGAYNLTAPEPVRMNKFCSTLGNILSSPSWFHVPSFIVRLIFGKMADEMLLSGQKALPEKLLANGFVFTFTDLKEAIQKSISDN